MRFTGGSEPIIFPACDGISSNTAGSMRIVNCGAPATRAKTLAISPAVCGWSSTRWNVWPSRSGRWAMWSSASAT